MRRLTKIFFERADKAKILEGKRLSTKEKGRINGKNAV